VGYNAATNAHATLNAPQMHNHRLQQWYANLGKRLAKFSAPWIDYSEDVATTRVLDCHMLYPQITPVSELPMNLQLSLVGGNMAAKNVFYVSAIGKKLIIKGGRIVGLETFTPKDVM
jgi:hypothetical protein